MERLGIKVWFDDGSMHRIASFDDWALLPADGVTEVLEIYAPLSEGAECYGNTYGGNDYYFMTPEGVLGSNNDPPETTQARYPGCRVLRGRWITNEAWLALFDTVTGEQSWP